MATSDTTFRLLSELEDIDQREDRILAALLQRLGQLEQRELRERSVSVADLRSLQTALDDIRAKVVKAQAEAVAPASEPANSGRPPTPALTYEQLQAQMRDQDASAKRMRELIAERLRTLAPLEPERGASPEPGHGRVPDRRPRTFRLDRPLMHGADVKAFQRVLNRRFAAWGVNRRIAENGTYGPKTADAAHQVALGLGLLSSDYVHGITPELRIVMRAPSRRTEAQKRRARGRVPYRAALRRRYAKQRVPRVPHDGGTRKPATIGNGNANGGAAGVGVAAAIRAAGGRYEDVIVREARQFGVPVALVCAVIDVESGFTNVFGHDAVRNPIKSPPRPAPDRVVTKELYLEYKRHRKLGAGSQGVGPMQLTFFALQDEADALGGCFVPEINIHVGVKHLASLIRTHGLHKGVQAYNLLDGHGYAELVLKRKRLWDERLGLAQRPAPGRPPAGSPKPAPRPRRAAPPTFRVRKPPMKGGAVRRLQRDVNQRFARWGIARQIAEDGVFGKATERAVHQVAIALGLQATAYEHGVTPRLRVLIRKPSLRSEQQKRRARSEACRTYRTRLRKRYGGSQSGGGGHAGAVEGSPKSVIDDIVLPIARKNGIRAMPQSVEAANNAHSVMTTSGNRSDHKGPPNVAWAADLSNGTSPTPEMDKLAADLARRFGIPWSGSGLVNHSAGGYRYQLIYRTNKGGNHFNHVHLGVKKL